MSKIEDVSPANLNRPNVFGAQYRLRVEAGRPKLDISVGEQWQNASSDDQIDSSKWVMITATWDGGIQKIYINGNLDLENSEATDGDIDNLTGGDLMIGKGWHPSSDFIKGSIYDVRIYNRALSSAEVAALYDLERPPEITTPEITWGTLEAITYGDALSEVQLNASADVAGSFTYEPVSGTVLAAGEHTLKATFTPEDGALDPVVSEVALVVNLRHPVITWAAPEAITYGTLLGQAQLSAKADVAGKFEYDPPIGTVLDSGEVTLRATFNPSNDNYAKVDAEVVLTINKAPLTVTAVNASRALRLPPILGPQA